MRLLALLLLSFSVAISAADEGDQTIKVQDSNTEEREIVLDGHLSTAQLAEQFEAIQAQGIDTSKPYKWEFRFTAKVMSSLENFSQMAHALDFWPVALESDVKGGKYWLYIQKTHQYNKSEFVDEVTTLFKMADYGNLDSFDGFSIDKPDTTAAN
ncbi:ribonuclease E inhibitor RraB [Alteromonas flava]|uniref:ribonuclease E inhibitor RraB n=1 Tax=Alteromonas flava TaxID=2048003 RepID=UPI0013DA5024|nr:ribonuclease E inhibitor RraB [Alteromonas flava]